jgi:hypothetical protein
MAQPYQFVRVSVTVFKVLACLSAAVQIVTGLILIVNGGDPVLIGGVEVPARLVGTLNFVAAAVYFFSLWLMSSVLKLLLDIRGRLPG